MENLKYCFLFIEHLKSSMSIFNNLINTKIKNQLKLLESIYFIKYLYEIYMNFVIFEQRKLDGFNLKTY